MKRNLREAGYASNEMEEMAKLAIAMLKDETSDWTNFDLSSVVKRYQHPKK